jgi:hypothetical protein
MKRVLTLLTVVCALFAVSACHYSTNVSVEATANMLYDNGGQLDIGPMTLDGFHRRSLSDSDVQRVINELIINVLDSYGANIPRTGVLYLRLFDSVSGKHLGDEEYGLVYNSGSRTYDFANLAVEY